MPPARLGVLVVCKVVWYSFTDVCKRRFVFFAIWQGHADEVV